MPTPEESEAIQPDVSGEQENPHSSTPPQLGEQQTGEQQPQPSLSPREEAMSRIVESREQEQSDEAQAFPAEAIDAEGKSSQTQPKTLRVKVDGVQKDIPIDKVKAVLQKNMAADQRLEEAAFRQQNLAKWEQQLLSREQALKSTTPQGKPEGEPPEDKIKEKIQTAVDKLYDGDTDDAVEALTGLFQERSQTPTLDPHRISEQATQNVMQTLRKNEREREVKTSKLQFENEYAELVSNPELYDIADKKTITLMQQHPDWTPTQVIMEAGRQTQQWVNTIKGDSGSHTTRLQRKTNLQGLPKTQGSVAYQPPEPKQGPTKPVDVIREMRHARGQA